MAEKGVKPTVMRPKKLGDLVEIIDPNHPRYGQVGHLQANRCFEGVPEVLLYFPATKTKGNMASLRWDQCQRKGGEK